MGKLTSIRAATFAVAAFSLCAIAQAQWASRWNTTGTADDEGQVCAVDRLGNVIVAGKSKNWGTDWDYAIVKYNAAGVKQWETHYDGLAHGADIPTSIAVDYDGQIYVGGTSWGNSTSWDLCVVKIAPDGQIPWTTSGSAGTGYAFDGVGAVRSTSTDSEGFIGGTSDNLVHVAMTIKQDWDSENRIIAITGSQKENGMLGAQYDGWVTCVLEPDPNAPGQVRVKSGWPTFGPTKHNVDDFPTGIAIGSDNSIFECGHTHQQTVNPTVEDEYFTTARLQASGGSSPMIWVDYWDPFTVKGSCATGIVLDRSNDCYVTGWGATASNGFDYVTAKYSAAGSGGSPNQLWWRNYNGPLVSGSDDEATAIDLTYEVESGAVIPFVHVTGFSGSNGNGFDIVTIRYRSDLTGNGTGNIYADRKNGSANGNDYGWAIVGAGRHAYVAGLLKQSTTNEDYGILGYHDDTTPLFFNPTPYDGASHFDEALSLAMIGAGALVATGDSDSNSTSLIDFATIMRNQTVATDSPSTDTMNIGTHTGGGVSDLVSDNSTYYVMHEATFAQPSGHIQVTFTGTSPNWPTISNPSEICLKYKGRYEFPLGGSQKIEIWDRVAGAWETVDFRQASISADTSLILPLKDDAMKYVNASTGEIKVRVTFKRTGTLGTSALYDAKIDLLTWDVVGP